MLFGLCFRFTRHVVLRSESSFFKKYLWVGVFCSVVLGFFLGGRGVLVGFLFFVFFFFFVIIKKMMVLLSLLQRNCYCT